MGFVMGTRVPRRLFKSRIGSPDGVRPQLRWFLRNAQRASSQAVSAETKRLTRGRRVHYPGALPMRPLRIVAQVSGGGEALIQGGQQKPQLEVPRAGSALGGAGSREDWDPGEARRELSLHPQGGAEDPSPIETTLSGKRGVPAQPLLAASAAPQLAGEPAPEEGLAPPHLRAASLPLPLLSSGRAPPPPPPPPPPPSFLPPGSCAPPAATGWEARRPPPRQGGGGASRGRHPRLRRGTRSEAPRRPCVWTGRAGALLRPPALGRWAWPRCGVEEMGSFQPECVSCLLDLTEAIGKTLPTS
ncbi:PREDICTED: WAS/WASL-interacting protein family member 3-like [Cercocebus atys]|uniref:WAS/WASL-interacting protein family member 3-like n=1 Tax=Cercocebus atys TaxID=9531 RepID=UPI0005F3CD33|nr:PREDICTED: WAS/WASL-interacting protein family member 3-like [Cercocebus atys]